jgi:D-glucosaminate PTS system EIIB component
MIFLKWGDELRNIVLTRIDDRLIHGQVVTAWVKQTKSNRIVIVDDSLAKDSFMQEVLSMAAPSGVVVEVLDCISAAELLKGESGKEERVTVLAKTPQIIETLINLDVNIKTVIVGGMGSKAGRKKFHKNISASDDEIVCFRKMINQGVNVLIQIVPDERAIDVSKLI